MAEADERTLDHLIARELGGDNSAENLVTACKACNCAKRDLSLRAFLAYLTTRGIDTDKTRVRIRNFRRRSWRKYMG
jgi:hypothetical protein